jgi:hypothetical protein
MNLALIFIGIAIFIIYISKKQQKIENFINTSDIALKVNNVFKKNFDLNYVDARDGKKHFSALSKLLSNQLPPINNIKRGKAEEGISTVQAVPKNLNTRVPDKLSNEKEYKIPLPKFDDLQQGLLKPLVKSFQELDNMNKVKYERKPKKIISKKPSKEEKKELFNSSVKKIEVRKIQKSNNCKFVTSFGDNKEKCPKDYSIYTGATFSGDGSTISCNGNNINAKRATGFAIIKNGSVVDIKLTEKGTHYYKEPKVYIRGLGRGARARAILKDNSVSDIIILSGGKNYNSTPTVIFEKPNIMVHCNLCCKNEL